MVLPIFLGFIFLHFLHAVLEGHFHLSMVVDVSEAVDLWRPSPPWYRSQS